MGWIEGSARTSTSASRSQIDAWPCYFRLDQALGSTRDHLINKLSNRVKAGLVSQETLTPNGSPQSKAGRKTGTKSKVKTTIACRLGPSSRVLQRRTCSQFQALWSAPAARSGAVSGTPANKHAARLNISLSFPRHNPVILRTIKMVVDKLHRRAARFRQMEVIRIR
jgi:hypothetical protein